MITNEGKIVQNKIYEDAVCLVYHNPVNDSFRIYEKRTDDFHNVFTIQIATVIDSEKDNASTTQLLYKLLNKEKGENNV